MASESHLVGGTSLAATDYRGISKRGDPRFRPAWGFKGDAVERILELIKDEPHPWMHACSGAAVIPGEDHRIDMHHPSAERIDVQDLDKHYQGLGVVVIDPPYGNKEWPLDARQRAMTACWRALRAGGLLVVHAPWQPRFAAEWMRLQEPIWFREDGRLTWPMTPVLICAYRKAADPKMTGPTRNGKRVRARARKRARREVRA